MSPPIKLHCVPSGLTSFFWSGEVIRSRSVSDDVLHDTLDIPAPPARLMADCDREASRTGLEVGDVEALSLVRARARWPGYRSCVETVSEWTRSLGLHDVLASSEVALMLCRGAKYHHDGAQYGGRAFCNIFLSEDKGLDLHFPSTGHRIPLCRGTAVIFDTCQPHAVIPRGSSRFEAADFTPGQERTQLFLTWELPLADANVARALGIEFDIEPVAAVQLRDEQVWLKSKLSNEPGKTCGGAPARVCPDSGRWLPAD